MRNVTQNQPDPARRLFLALGAATALGPANVMAQGFPNRPVRVLVGTPAGGLADIVARVLAHGLSDSMGQPFVVENRAGAAGVIAADAVAKAPPDGHTLLAATDSMAAVNQFVYPKMPYDPDKDLQSVAMLGKATLVLVAHPDLPAKSLNAFIQLVRSRPNAYNYSSGGPGHPLHLAMELLLQRLGLAMGHVPYKGAAPAVQGLLGAEVQAMIVGAAEALPHIKVGKLVPLAATGPSAEELFPSLPQLKSLHRDLDISPWFALFAPARTSPQTVAALNAAVNQYLKSTEAQKRLAEIGIKPVPLSPTELDALVAAERKVYGPLVKSLGITP